MVRKERLKKRLGYSSFGTIKYHTDVYNYSNFLSEEFVHFWIYRIILKSYVPYQIILDVWCKWRYKFVWTQRLEFWLKHYMSMIRLLGEFILPIPQALKWVMYSFCFLIYFIFLSTYQSEHWTVLKEEISAWQLLSSLALPKFFPYWLISALEF